MQSVAHIDDGGGEGGVIDNHFVLLKWQLNNIGLQFCLIDKTHLSKSPPPHNDSCTILNKLASPKEDSHTSVMIPDNNNNKHNINWCIRRGITIKGPLNYVSNFRRLSQGGLGWINLKVWLARVLCRFFASLNQRNRPNCVNSWLHFLQMKSRTILLPSLIPVFVRGVPRRDCTWTSSQQRQFI